MFGESIPIFARKTFDPSGNLLTVHEYVCPAGGCQTAEDRRLQKITLVKARQDFTEESRKAAEQIEQAKFDALYRLAWQDEVVRLQIKENVDSGIAQISNQIASLESQRYQTVKQCHRFLFWKTCKEYTYEVPGVQDAINQLAVQRAELFRIGEEQLANIPGAMAQKKREIEQSTADKFVELERQKQDFLEEILREEMDPVLIDQYRRVLGRDPSTAERNAWVDRFRSTQTIDLGALVSELSASSEKGAREAEKTTIIQEVRNFLTSYLEGSSEQRALMLPILRLNVSETVALDMSDVAAILVWLESRDLHFGQSAFLSLKQMLASRGVNVPMTLLGKETILIDILTGTLNRFSEGDLLISMFALDRAAAIHSQDFSTVLYTFENLRAIYASACGLQPVACGLRVVAHLAEDHFVVITRVTYTEVRYMETSKGASGEEVTVSREQFMKVWDQGNGAGYLLVAPGQLIGEKQISEEQSKKIRGAFFGIDDLIFWAFVASLVFTAASVVVSFFSPTLGKILGYAALVAGIVGIVASIGQLVVQGLKMAFSQIAEDGFLATIKQGIASIGKVLLSPVRFVGRFIQDGFVFLKDGFTGGFGSLGTGITRVKDFLLTAAGDAIYKGGVLIGHKFTFGQMMMRQLVAAGLNIGVSKGLEGLGLNSQLAQLAGAFVGGGFLGIGSATSGFIHSGLSNFALQGVSQIANHLGLAPPISDALSLLANTGLSSFFNGNFGLKPFTEIAPQLTSQFTLGGLELLGRSMGLDSRLTQLLGLPFAAITQNVAGIFLGNSSFSLNPSGIFGLIKEALLGCETLGGVFSLSASFLIDRLDLDQSLLGSLSSRLIGGIFSDYAASPARFSFVDSMIKSFDESIYHFLEPAQLSQLFESIRESGLVEGATKYATALFTKETLMEFTSAGMDLSEWIEHGIPVAEDIVYEGESAKRVRLTQNGKTIAFVYVPKGARLEVRQIFEEDKDGHVCRLVQWDTDAEGKITKVIVEEQMGNGVIRRDVMDPDGRVKEIFFTDWSGQIYGRVSFNAQGTIEFTNYALGISNYLSADGRFTFDFSLAPDLQDLNQLLHDFNTDLRPGDIAQLAAFTYGNGFWNSHQSPDSISSVMAAFMAAMNKDQASNGTPGVVLFDANGNIARDRHGNILTTGSLPITLYEETSLVGNVFRWMADTWFGCNFMRDEIEAELTRYFDLIELNQKRFGLDPNMKFVHFSHSGNFQPMIEALEHMDDKYRSHIKTLVVYEGPYVGDGIINDPYLETRVRVRGVKSGPAVPLLEQRDFQITDQNDNVQALHNQYNIEIIGAGHSDFSYDPSFEYASPEEREIARKTSLFMRELTLAAADSDKLFSFLNEGRIGINYDEGRRIYSIDPLLFESALER